MRLKIKKDLFCAQCGNNIIGNGFDYRVEAEYASGLKLGLLEQDTRNRCGGGIASCSEKNIEGKSPFCFKCGMTNITEKGAYQCPGCKEGR